MSAEKKIYACDFEIFGKVQGVFFRKYTQKTALKLKVVGFCMNTPEGTVRGQMEGSKSQLDEMKRWLRETGSPQSRIEKAVFSEWKEIAQYSFMEFSIRH